MEAEKKDKMFDAQKYLDEHGIEKMVSEMLNSLLHEKSENPKIYMIKYLAGQLTKEELEQNKLVIPEPYPKPYISKKKKNKSNNNEEAKNEDNLQIKANEGEVKLQEDKPKEEEDLKVSNVNDNN